ncbi:cytochrome c oxidase subunit II [Paenibacillus sp. y28]|uniref:cytochrome c oxidase subunit II n=1 Tax=Paenibacillus sp. y28 TaxID=3129110 RepID=UPI003FA78B7B
MKRWLNVWRLIPLFAVLTFVLTGCGKENLTTLKPKGPVAQDQLWLIGLSLGIMILVLITVFIIYAYVLVKFRRRKEHTEYPKQVEGSHTLEIIWTVIPFVLLLILAVPTIYYTFKLDKDYTQDPNAIQVKVIGHQFWWEFEYLNEKITTGMELYVPTNRIISFELQSADVIHSFWVPALGGKKDTNPGSGAVNHMYLQADQEGVYYGKCAELCGTSHALMDFKVIAVSPEKYDAWVKKMQQPVAVTANASEGEKIFKDKCIACHAIYDSDKKGIVGGKVGPNLANYAERQTVAGILFNHTEENPAINPQLLKSNLKEWLADPQKVKPGNLMPNPIKIEGSKMKDDLGLNEKQVDALVDFISSQKLQ